LINLPVGCPFAPRCPYAFDKCVEEAPPLESVFSDPSHRSACWLPSDLDERRALAASVFTEEVS
ncbi:MAG: ABC transporter ATP-binding protein, partial [Actinomycetota bacterium]